MADGSESGEGRLGFEALDSPNTVAVAISPKSSRGNRDLSRNPFSGEAPATSFPVEFGHNNLQTCSTLHKESNATRITPIGVQTEKIRLVKVLATTNSAVSFSELCLRFPASHDVPKVRPWVLGVPRHLHFSSPVAAYSDSHCDGRKTCTKVARWRGRKWVC